MSQNKTVVPGMEDGSSYKRDDANDFYSRGTNAKATSKGTVVPGMETNYGTTNPATSGGNPQQVHRHTGKPIVGFLYSISRQGIGEYWPVYIGQNTIGSSNTCDICLQEGTVSSDHAILVIRKMKNPEKTIASIADARSTNGTMVNGESLGFSAVECFNGDILTIGENYELVLLLVDAKALGLTVSENFIPISKPSESPVELNPDPYSPGYTQPGNPYPPKFESPDQFYQGNQPSDGTVGMDGYSNPAKPGGTVGM